MLRLLQASRPTVSALRTYSIRTQAKKINKYIDRIGDESTKELQRTIKIVRKVGGISIIVVLCSLLWASSLSAPVKETAPVVPDLTIDVRDQ